MKNILCVIVLLTTSVFIGKTVFANNITVSNVDLIAPIALDKNTMVQFDLTWENSWRNDINWDAAWVFMKFSIDDGLTNNHVSAIGEDEKGFIWIGTRYGADSCRFSQFRHSLGDRITGFPKSRFTKG